MNWTEAERSLLAPLIGGRRVGLVSDFDGTVSPIVANPDDARATERARAALTALAERLALLAFVSGRAVNDLRARAQINGAVYIGNHGMEHLTAQGITTPPEVATFRTTLDVATQTIASIDLPGLRLEDKRVTLSLHYRNTPDPDAAAAQLEPILNQLAAQHGLRVFRGRMVFELRPPFDINKGTALRTLVESHQLDAVAYIGDDTTDADALRVARQLREAGICQAVGVGVASDETPQVVRDAADMMVEGIAGVEAFLEWLLAGMR